MQVDMFNNMVCEVEAVYRPKISPSKNPKIASDRDAVDYVRPAYSDIMNYSERACALFLNRGNRVIGLMKISDGARTSAIIDAGKIFQLGLKINAAGFLLFHNHPSGNINPSKSDLEITKKVQAGAPLVEMTLLDHIILTETDHYSFKENGHL